METAQAEAIYKEHWRPGWGSIAVDEVMWAQELFREHRPEHFLEVGMASGLSAGYFATIMEENGGKTLTTLDHDNTFFGDQSKENGFLIEEVYQGSEIKVEKKPFTTAIDVPDLGGQWEMGFIDANHQHPWPLIDTLCIYPFLTGPKVLIHHDLKLFRDQDVPFGIGPKYLYDQMPHHLRMRSEANRGNIFALKMDITKQEMETIAMDAFCLPWTLRSPLKKDLVARLAEVFSALYSDQLVNVFQTAVKRFNRADRLPS